MSKLTDNISNLIITHIYKWLIKRKHDSGVVILYYLGIFQFTQTGLFGLKQMLMLKRLKHKEKRQNRICMDTL